MGYLETTGVLLSRRNMFEDDQEIVLLTPENGCLSARAPHARKSQKTFCGRLEPPNRLSVRLYRARDNSRWTLTEAEIRDVYADLLRRDDLRRPIWPLLGLFRDLFPEGEPPGPCYTRLIKAFTILKQGFRPALLVVDRLLVTTARQSGIGLPMERCRRCGETGASTWSLSPESGLLCSNCAADVSISHSLDETVRSLYEQLRTESWEHIRERSCSHRALGELESLMYRWFHHHFEISLNSLKVRKHL